MNIITGSSIIILDLRSIEVIELTCRTSPTRLFILLLVSLHINERYHRLSSCTIKLIPVICLVDSINPKSGPANRSRHRFPFKSPASAGPAVPNILGREIEFLTSNCVVRGRLSPRDQSFSQRSRSVML